MEFVETIKLISEVGFLAVASGVFVVLAIKLFNKQQEMLENFIKQGGLSQAQAPQASHPSSEDSVALDIVNNKIYQEMRGVLNALQADRSYVFLYHNGGVSTSGLFFQKMSCICEVVSQGILPVASQSQNLHRTSYSLFCDELKTNGEVLVSNPSELKGKDNFLYQELVSRRSFASYFRALKDANGHAIGFIGIDYCIANENITTDEISKLLKTVSLKVSSLVDIRDEVQ